MGLWNNEKYLVARLFLWMGLASLVLIDTLCHCKARPRGLELHRAIGVVLAFFLVTEFSMVGYAYNRHKKSLYNWVVFIYYFSNSLFLGLLLLIAGGWKITKSSIPNKKTLLILPPIYFLATSINEYVQDNWALIEVNNTDTNTTEYKVQASRSAKYFVDMLYFVSTMALFFGWWWILVFVGEEKKNLKEKLAAHEAELEAARAREAEMSAEQDDGNEEGEGAHRLESVDIDGEEEEVFNAASIGDLQAVRRTQPLQTRLVEEGFHGHDSTMPDKAKLRLMFQYGILVQAFIVIKILILFVGAVTFNRPSNRFPWQLLVFEDMVQLVFVFGLAFVFRLRQVNPYFVLDDYISSEPASGPAAHIDSIPAGNPYLDNEDFDNDKTPLETSPPMEAVFSIDSDDDGHPETVA
eukprot:m.57191 g.57191  ORF g.57191 m.57191 type:complete len:409 (-) comp11088_c0_seq1:152-1378(-)